MKVFLPAFLALAALAPCSAGFAQQAPPAKLTTAQTKQIAKAQTVMNGFMAAARKGDTKKAKTFCADTPEMNFEGLLDAENAARLKAWANSFPKSAFQKGSFHTYEEPKKTVIMFGYNHGKRKGDTSFEYDPKIGKLVSLGADAD